MLINLVDNALLYRRAEIPPAITLSARREEGETVLWVADNGIGIFPEFHRKIFEAFQRLHIDDVYFGTGIGLAAVAKAVQLMGGPVTGETRLGEGSTFVVRLPAADVTSEFEKKEKKRNEGFSDFNRDQPFRTPGHPSRPTLRFNR